LVAGGRARRTREDDDEARDLKVFAIAWV